MVCWSVGNRDLAACADGQSHPSGDGYSPNDQARSEEELVSPLAFAIRPVSVVGLDFGPEIFQHAILKRRVKQDRRAGSSPLTAVVRHGYAQGALAVEITPAFAKGHRWGER